MPKEFFDEPLETASELEQAGIIKRSCAYKLSRAGILPSYLVGPKQTGVRFRRSEVLAALRRPATAGKVPNDRHAS
jgi:hypothetical protein